jgi:uncharacterized protein YpmS
MILFFVGLLVLAIIGTFYCYNQIKKINFPSKIVASTFQDKDSFYEKIKSSDLQENIEITITQEELTAVTSGGLSGRNFIIKNTQVIINENSVDIFGTLTKPLSSQIKIVTVPKVNSGKVKFEVQKFTAGNLSMPKFISDKIAESISKTMDENFSEFYTNYEVENINLFDGKMIISGKLK